MNKVITRFAPSPTGALHLGGARTALFNWLYARKHNGLFKLRIEDTDKVRSKRSYTDEIRQGLLWLGLKWDGEVIYQSQNIYNHIELAEKLLSERNAYRCYCTKDEIEEARDKAKKEKKAYKYDRKWRDYKGEINKPYVIRIKIPLNKETVLNDKILGRIVINNNELDDFIILRTDKTPTYMLSVVADDKLMGITDVIRGDDHLTNTFKQIILYDLLGWKKPEYSHIPLIHSKEGNKLSKRDGALSVLSYRDENFISEAFNNYLLRLGWGYKDKEIFSLDEARKLFYIKGIGKSPAKFDMDKLNYLNSYYIRKMSWNDLIKQPLLKKTLKNLEYGDEISKIIDLFKERAQRISDLECGLKYMLNNRYIITKEAEEIIKHANIKLLKNVVKELENINNWVSEEISNKIKECSRNNKSKIYDIAAPIRASLTGQKYSPNIFKILEYLGRSEVMCRLKKSFLT